MLSRMQQAGLLTRVPAAGDRRALEVAITEAGEDRLIRATPIYMDSVQRTFGARLSADDAAALAGLLGGVAEGPGSPHESALLVPFGETVLAVTRGAVATSDAVQVRNALEPLLVAQASQHLTPGVVAEMRATVGRMSGLLERPEDFFRADWYLHRVIAGACPNITLKAVYLSLLDVIEAHLEYVVPTANLNDYLSRRLIVHARLVDAVCSRDLDRARQAAREHDFTSAAPRVLTDITAPAGEDSAQ
jgi:DNA-binding MarR family transcriptional regulator